MENQKILILFAHPRLEKSKINRILLDTIPSSGQITFHDLYEKYPDFNIDIEKEKQLLSSHSIIIWHHPFYWYSCPPLLKQWIDMVLEFGWAYGPSGTALKDKLIFNCITTGGAKDAYMHEGRNRFTIREFLAPFEQTVRLCQMHYLPPFAILGTHRLSDAELADYAEQFKIVIRKLSKGDYNLDKLMQLEFLNELSHLSVE
jgi:glutathione-regulated potassium-efflux system ancillary protein KefG